MQTATTMIYQILNNEEKLKGIDFFTNSVPEDSQKLEKLPVSRIVELQGDYGNYASNEPNTIRFDVQVDVWLKHQRDVEQYYYLFDSILRKQSWVNTYSSIEEDSDLNNAKRIIKRYTGTFRLEL